MSKVYLRECLFVNYGPIHSLDLSLKLDQAGNPKPVILVGQNGSGKTIFLAHVVDALTELAKKAYNDSVLGQQSFQTPYFMLVGGANVSSGAPYSISLLEFSGSDAKFSYVQKVGAASPEHLAARMRGRFEDHKSWPPDEHYKDVGGSKKEAEGLFGQGAVCFFPSSRHERPHWLNLSAVSDIPVFGEDLRISGSLGKPIVAESTANANRRWLMDVMLDSLVEVDYIPHSNIGVGIPTMYLPAFQGDLTAKMALKQSRMNIERLLRKVLQDDTVTLALNYRNDAYGRLGVRTKWGARIPSLDHLSAGQAVLFNTFATIIRYADRHDLNKSIQLHDIEGIVLIDEIDAHLHTSLQYEVLPTLCKLFPKVQFIMTSHAPLFVLGMENAYGSDGIQIVEMPNGRAITTERFAEFQKSFEYYQRTKTFEEAVGNAVEAQLGMGSKPIVLTEGKIDARYVKTALELLGRGDLLDRLEVACVGTAGSANVSGSGSGKGFLGAAFSFLRDNPAFVTRRVLLLYDHDANKEPLDQGNLSVRSIPRVPTNTRMKKGIENLFADALFDTNPQIATDFTVEKPKPTDYLVESTIREFDKQAFCEWMCSTRRNPDDFKGFSVVVELLKEFLNPSPCRAGPAAERPPLPPSVSGASNEQQ